MLNYILVIFYIFLISIIAQRFSNENKEISRKIIHIGIGPLIPIAHYLKIDQNSALLFTGIFSILILINYIFRLIPIIEDVDRKSFGTLFYCLSLFILIFLFWEKDPNSLIAGLFIMTFGDGLAGLIGKVFDSKSWIIFKQKKSLYGTLTMLLTSLIVVCTLGYIQINTFDISFLAIASLATLLEQFSTLGIDNFLVPISSSICFNILVTNQ